MNRRIPAGLNTIDDQCYSTLNRLVPLFRLAVSRMVLLFLFQYIEVDTLFQARILNPTYRRKVVHIKTR